MKHFEIGEFIVSATAKANKIDNTPAQWQIDNCERMVDALLDPLREAWAVHCANEKLGSPALKVTSGIRSKALNDIIPGASKTSAHHLGYAADLWPYNGRLKDFKRFCYDFLRSGKVTFDQMISEGENEDGIPQWIHLGYRRADGSQRERFLSCYRGNYVPIRKV